MANDHGHGAPLTRNQALVFDVLHKADGPLSAYSILDALRAAGFRAPLQVYRALEKLIEFGMVHRLESLNAFVACQHPDCDVHEPSAFAICDKCGHVKELSDEGLVSHLVATAEETGMVLTKATVELRGVCAKCR